MFHLSKRQSIILVMALFLLISVPFVSATTSVVDGEYPFSTILAGGTTGDPDGAGVAEIILQFTTNEICHDIDVSNITLPVTAVHIHNVATGAIVVDLNISGEIIDALCVASTPEVMQPILDAPQNYYVNVHNADFPGGAISGILQPDAPFSFTFSSDPNADTDGTAIGHMTFDTTSYDMCFFIDSVTVGHYDPTLQSFLARATLAPLE